MSVAQRRAAERAMAERDRRERRGGRSGQRAAARSRAPDFLQDDDEDDGLDFGGDLLSGMRPRARRDYDERRNVDDMEGVEDVSVFSRYIMSRMLIMVSGGHAGRAVGRHQGQVDC